MLPPTDLPLLLTPILIGLSPSISRSSIQKTLFCSVSSEAKSSSGRQNGPASNAMTENPCSARLFSTALFERYQRSEKALVSALAEMYAQGVSTRKVKEVTETLCGHSFSASTVSEMNRTLDTALRAFAARPLAEPYPYLILDVRSNADESR